MHNSEQNLTFSTPEIERKLYIKGVHSASFFPLETFQVVYECVSLDSKKGFQAVYECAFIGPKKAFLRGYEYAFIGRKRIFSFTERNITHWISTYYIKPLRIEKKHPKHSLVDNFRFSAITFIKDSVKKREPLFWEMHLGICNEWLHGEKRFFVSLVPLHFINSSTNLHFSQERVTSYRW